MPGAVPPSAQRPRQGAVFAFLVLAVTLAVTSEASAMVTAHSLVGSATPTSQQPVTRANADLTFGFSTSYDSLGNPTPTLTDATWHFDDDFVFDLSGVPRCNPQDLSGKTTAQAVAACPDSAIGSGTAVAKGFNQTLSSTVTAFHGLTPQGGVPPNPLIYLHIYYNGSNPNVPGAITAIGGGPLTTSTNGSDFGTQYQLSPPSGVPSAPGFAFTDLQVTLTEAPSHPEIVKARCNDNDATWNFAGAFDFGGTQNFSPATSQACTKVGNTLTVTPTGAGTGAVTGPGISCPADCTDVYEPGTVVDLTEVPGSGSTFNGWGGGVCTIGPPETCQVTMDAAKGVTADFTKNTNSWTLTVTPPTGSGDGRITGDGINCGDGPFATDCTEVYADAEVVELTAVPATGSDFGAWTNCPGDPPGDSCLVTMDMDRSLSASFVLEPPMHTLIVTKAGGGFGSITSAPGGITCPGDCNQVYVEDTMVTLTATPAGSSTFTGWSGGVCSGSAVTCEVTMNAAKSVTATFAAQPATFTVNTFDDGNDTGANGVCATAGSLCTIRAAVQEANQTAAADTINFSVTGEHLATSVVGGAGPLLSITTPMTINGNTSGAGTALDGDDQHQVIFISSTSGAVNLNDLRIQDGHNEFVFSSTPPTVNGGGIQVIGLQTGITPTVTLDGVTVTGNDVVSSSAADAVGQGGGIFAGLNVTLNVIDSTVSGNTVLGTGKGSGAGIHSLGNMSLIRSTVSGNQIVGGATRIGGGIAAAGVFATTSIANSTVSGNGATMGGGLHQGGPSATISASTFAANTASGGGADFYSASGTATAKSSIFASPNACALESGATLASAGRNLDNGATCGFGTSNGNLQNTNPMLASLTNNGGPTMTHALTPGSPAIDAGSAVDGVTTDQRGTPRPQGTGCDIGAYELASALGASCVATTVPDPDPDPGGSGGGGGGGGTVAQPKKCKKGQKLKKGKCVKKRKPKKK